MIFGSVCSGIEATSAAWLPIGWRCAFMSEIETFPRAVLGHHYPETPLHGDFTTIRAGEYDAIDALVGGTPCQSFSVAGLRGGLADERGNLALEYLRLAERLRPRWLVWENVPGVLSSGAGRDFGAFVGGLAELGYGWAYRVLDAQYFGLAQRRKRVFVVGCLGDWRRAAAVLFEPASLRWHPAPRRETGERVANAITERPDRGGGNSEGQRLIAASLTRGADGGSGYRNDPDTSENLIASTLEAGSNRTGGTRPPGTTVDTCDTLIAMSLNAHGGAGRMDGESETFVTHSLCADGFDASEDDTGRGTPLVFNHKASAHQSMNPGPISPGLDIGKSDGLCVAYTLHGADKTVSTATETHLAGSIRTKPPGSIENSSTTAILHAQAFQTSQSGVRDHDTHATLDANNGSRRHNGAIIGSAVRRLTPRECERLQGFPDDYTLIPYRGKPASDGPRYRALGNSMAVPVMAWIGRRMERIP